MKNPFEDVPGIGSSIAHDGACMTVTEADEKFYSFQAIEESLSRTNFWTKNVWGVFNVEQSVTMNQRLDGHLLSGHIDDVGVVEAINEQSDGSKSVFISYDQKYDNLIVEKGWIAINGVSLTVVDDETSRFSVALIPITQSMTNLGLLTIGDQVNLEFDMMAKHVVKYLEKNNS